MERHVFGEQPGNRVNHWLRRTSKGVVQPVKGHRFDMYIIVFEKRQPLGQQRDP